MRFHNRWSLWGIFNMFKDCSPGFLTPLPCILDGMWVFWVFGFLQKAKDRSIMEFRQGRPPPKKYYSKRIQGEYARVRSKMGCPIDPGRAGSLPEISIYLPD